MNYINWFNRYAMGRPLTPHEEVAGTAKGLIQHKNQKTPLCDECLAFKATFTRSYTRKEPLAPKAPKAPTPAVSFPQPVTPQKPVRKRQMSREQEMKRQLKDTLKVYIIDPTTGEKVEKPKVEKSPRRFDTDARTPSLTEKPERRQDVCGGIDGVKQHNQNNERLCKRCLDYLDAHPEIDDADCGTEEGYQRHVTLGMKPCLDCEMAHQRAQKDKKGN